MRTKDYLKLLIDLLDKKVEDLETELRKYRSAKPAKVHSDPNIPADRQFALPVFPYPIEIQEMGVQ